MAKRKKNIPYPPELIAEAKKLYVVDAMSTTEIAKLLKGPKFQTIANWSLKRDSSGRTWRDEREEYQHALYENLSPASQAKKVMDKINVILNMDNRSFTTKDADALAKLSKFMQQIVDAKFQIPAMFDVLTRLMNFLKANYSALVNEELINAVKHFKNSMIEDMNA